MLNRKQLNKVQKLSSKRENKWRKFVLKQTSWELIKSFDFQLNSKSDNLDIDFLLILKIPEIALLWYLLNKL